MGRKAITSNPALRDMRHTRGWLGLILSCGICGGVGPATAPVVAQEAAVNAAAVRHYNLAVGLQNKKLYAQAAAKWDAFLKMYPQDERIPFAHHYLGICQLQEQKLPEAIASFKTVLATYPKFASLDASQFNLGLALYNVANASKKPDDYKAALAAFTEVPTKFPQSKHAAAAGFYQGECAYLAGDVPGAIAAYQKQLATYPQSPLAPEVYYALGTAQQEANLDADATATYTTFLQKFPQDVQAPECKLRLGLVQLKQAKFAEAEATFGQAAATPNFALADFALLKQGHAMQGREQHAAAAALLLTVPQKFPMTKHRGEALVSAGKAWFHAAKYPEAQQALAPVVAEKLPEGAEAAYWTSRVLIKLMKPAEAVTALDQALAAFPQSPLVPQLLYGKLDALYEQPEKRKEVVPLFAEFAAKHPDHELAPQALYMAGLTALQLADYPVATTHANAFLANAKFAKHALTPEVLFVAGDAVLLPAEPNAAKAEELFRRIPAEFPMHKLVPQAQVRIGLALQLAKKYDPAVAHLTAALPNLKDPALAAEAQLLIGRSHADALRLDPAIAAYRAALAAKPDWPRNDEVLLALAVALRTQKKPAEAIPELVKLHTNYAMSPYRPQAFYQLGEIAFDEKKYDDAVAAYKQVVAQYPKGELAPAAQLGVAWSLYTKEDFANAVPALTSLITDYAMSDLVPRGLYLRGLCQRRLMQFDPALKDLNDFLAKKPAEKEAREARYAIGLCQVGLKQYDPAAATFQALLKEKPDDPEADKVWYELAYALSAAKKDVEAAEAFKTLATKYPDSARSAESWFRVGESLEAAAAAALAKQAPAEVTARWTEAATAYATGVTKAKDPELKERLYYKQSWALFENGKFADAVAPLQAQLKEFPQGKLLLASTFLLGECFFRQDKFTEALPLYAAVIAAKGTDTDKALYRSGTCDKNLKKWPESQAHFKALIDQFPKYELVSEARYGLGLALQMQNKLDEAKVVYEQVTKETNAEAAARSRYMMGECAFAQKKFPEAIEHFLETALGYPYETWQAEAYFEAGRCFIELKDVPRAKETLETVVTKYPNHARAKDAMGLLANLK